MNQVRRRASQPRTGLTLLLPVFPCYVRKNRQFSLLVERPPVNIFSSSVDFSVRYGLFLPLLDLRSFLYKTGIFFYVSGTLDWVTGGKFQTTAKATTRPSPLLALTLRSATAHAPGYRRPYSIKVMAPCPRTNMGSAGPSSSSAGRQASKTKNFLTRSSPVVRCSAYLRSQGSGNGSE